MKKFRFRGLLRIVALFIFLLGCSLRFYRLPQSAMFLSDQGRDAIIVYNIATLKHFPAIGPPTSIGQVYLGPFYYYLMAPFLLIFNFDPVGLAYGVAFLSCLFIAVSFFLVRKLFGQVVALFFLFLTSFSFINIEQSRFSWNPNLLPFFSFFTLYAFYLTITQKKISWGLAFGSLLSLSMQLHYLSILLILSLLTFLIIESNLPTFVFNLKHSKKIIVSLAFASFFSFLFFSIPLVIFDLRHDFLNTKNLITLLTQGNLINSQSLKIFPFFASVFLILISIKFLKRLKKTNRFILLNLIHVVIFVITFRLINAPPHIHYFGPIYLSTFLTIAFSLDRLRNLIPQKLNHIFLVVFFFGYLIFNFRNYHFLWQKGDGQINHSKKVANFLAEKIGDKPFNIATWPVEFAEDNYVYFLILKGLKPADRQRLEITNQMFVLCQKEPCQVIDSPSWNISMFGPAKIDKIWKFEGLTIYKLIHLDK